MPWEDELYDTPTRIYISAVFFFFTLLLSIIVGDEYALAYIVLTLLILHTPPAWRQPAVAIINPYIAPYVVEQPPAPFRRLLRTCLLYTSPSPRDLSTSRMPSSA